MYVIKYESHFDYLRDYTYRHRANSFVGAYFIYCRLNIQYLFSTKPVRYLGMYKVNPNGMIEIIKFTRKCTDWDSYIKLKRSA